MNTSLLYENSSRITRSLLGLGEYGRSYLEHPSAGVTGFSNSTSPADDEYLNSYFAEVTAISDPSYLTVYQWEHFELRRWRKWMGNYWSLSIYASLVYLIVIFSVQRFMKNREPFNLRGLLTCWNFALAAFSIMGFLRTAPEIFHVLKSDNGFHTSICIRDEHNLATAFWGWLMALSKMVELGDTIFIVLRKQPLIFLHWYHHISVLVYVWYTYETYEPPLRYFMTMNMFVHALMYTYYVFKAMKFRVPRNWAMLITVLQLSQMIVGVTINVYSIYVKAILGSPCACRWENINLGMGMYASYCLLFANYFRHAYILNPSKSLIRRKAD